MVLEEGIEFGGPFELYPVALWSSLLGLSRGGIGLLSRIVNLDELSRLCIVQGGIASQSKRMPRNATGDGADLLNRREGTRICAFGFWLVASLGGDDCGGAHGGNGYNDSYRFHTVLALAEERARRGRFVRVSRRS